MGAPVDVSKLAVIVKATREGGDIASRIKVAETEIQRQNSLSSATSSPSSHRSTTSRH